MEAELPDQLFQTVRTTGPAEVDPGILSVRGLEPHEMEGLTDARPSAEVSPLKRLRQRHHALARALASGIKDGEAAALTGYDQSRVSILKQSPAFQELVSYYAQNVEDIFETAHRQLANTMMDGVELLALRLEKDIIAEEEGGEPAIGTSMVLEIVKTLADRTGHGVSSVQTTVNVDMADRLRQRREAARAAALDLEARDITPSAA